MSRGKCIYIISSCVCFLLLILLYVASLGMGTDNSSFRFFGIPTFTLTLFPSATVKCSLHYKESRYPDVYGELSLVSLMQATSKDKGLELHGLPVYLNLKNACQPLDDVSKAKIQVHKVALVTLVNETACPFQDLAVNAQNAGYSVLIYFSNDSVPPFRPIKKKLLVSVLYVDRTHDCHCSETYAYRDYVDDLLLQAADRTNIVIRVPSDALSKMKTYLERLYYWFFIGPIITLEWLRRTKKLCCMSGRQQVDEGQADRNETVVESELRTMEEGENRIESQQPSFAEQPVGNHQESRDGERTPLLIDGNDGCKRRPRGTRCLDNIRNIFNKISWCFRYLILFIAALPVGISSCGLSFFRFDDGETPAFYFSVISNAYEVPLLWSPFQIACFFRYSWVVFKNTGTIPTKFSKLIRSEWFASNMYLVVLGLVVPYCSLSTTETTSQFNFVVYFATYNTVCTVCNVLFIAILDKHKFVTRYVFYISVCMVCAYIESDVVAVFYFALNSQGSLNNLKLTALRTVAIGLTITISFSSSMHIIRKLTKPRESLFEGLGEK